MQVCQKSGEISLLKQQLKDSQADVGHKLSEIVNLKAALREAKNKMGELERKSKENEDAIRTRCAEVEVQTHCVFLINCHQYSPGS